MAAAISRMGLAVLQGFNERANRVVTPAVYALGDDALGAATEADHHLATLMTGRSTLRIGLHGTSTSKHSLGCFGMLPLVS